MIPTYGWCVVNIVRVMSLFGGLRIYLVYPASRRHQHLKSMIIRGDVHSSKSSSGVSTPRKAKDTNPIASFI
jgi:hypothetical protein